MPKAKKTAKETKAEAAQTVEMKAAEVAEAVEEVKPAAKDAGKSAAAAAEKAGKSAAAECGKGTSAVYVQYQGKEQDVEALIASAKAAFAAEQPGVKVDGLKLYIKPEEGAVYYVVNDTFNGRVDF